MYILPQYVQHGVITIEKCRLSSCDFMKKTEMYRFVPTQCNLEKISDPYLLLVFATEPVIRVWFGNPRPVPDWAKFEE